uniref:Plastocyanin-like domain-containing protein n=1 Tax=Schistosoma curassoni TaxID=6186 RepID=A0A183KR87_9TREM
LVVRGVQQETLDPGFWLLGTRQQGVPIISRGLVLPDGFYPVSLSLTVRDVTTSFLLTTSNHHLIST